MFYNIYLTFGLFKVMLYICISNEGESLHNNLKIYNYDYLKKQIQQTFKVVFRSSIYERSEVNYSLQKR